MYHKLHKRLTLLFTGVAGAILIVMSVSYLYMSETELSKNSLLSFSSNVDSLISGLEQQSDLTWEWLSKTAANQGSLLALYDNGASIAYNRTVLSEEELFLADEVKAFADEHYPQLGNGSSYFAAHQEFTYTAKKETYHASVFNIRKNYGILTGIILSSTKPFLQQIRHQRLKFAAINIAGILILLAFSYYFTGKLLEPVIEARKKQTAFVAAASHELRTPIAVICSAISASKSADGVKKERFFEMIEEEAMRISTLADDLLLLNRSDTGKLLLNKQPTELDTLLLDTYEAFLPLAKEHDVTLNVLLPDDAIPSCNCDSERIRQILGILITNAFHYSMSQGRVTLSLSYSRPYFWIGVEDNGIGISEEDKPHIFDRFYRADKSRSGKNHFGLGLSIAKEITDAHNGKIMVTDTPGGGARFYVLLS